MDWFGLGKHTFTFSSSLFDIGSDITNSLSFLGVFNPNTSTNITLLNFPNSTHQLTNSSLNSLCTINEITDCMDRDYREDVIWGIMSLAILFLPGYFSGISTAMEEIHEKDYCDAALVILFATVCFPFILFSFQLMAIIHILQKKKVSQESPAFFIAHFFKLGA